MKKKSTPEVAARKQLAPRKPEQRRSSAGRGPPKPAPRRKAATAQPRSFARKPAVAPAAAATTFAFYLNPIRALACQPGDAPGLFSLETLAGLTGVHPELLRYYCRLGLLGADRAANGREPIFDEAALREVRRIEHYRRHLAVSRRALPLVCELRRQAERQQIEIHFLRCP